MDKLPETPKRIIPTIQPKEKKLDGITSEDSQTEADKPTTKDIKDLTPEDVLGVIIENITPIPGVRPAGKLKTYHRALIGHNTIQIYMSESKTIDAIEVPGVVGQFETWQPGLKRINLDETIRNKWGIQRVALVFDIEKPK